MMDDIKVKTEVDLLALPEHTNTGKCLTEDNWVSQRMYKIKVECEDPTSVIKCETTPFPTSFATVKCKLEEGSCDVAIVKEDLLDVTTEDDGSLNRFNRPHCHEMRIQENGDCSISVQHQMSPEFVSCGEILFEQQDLTDTRSKSFVCKVCGKTLTRKHTLAEHVLIHTGEKPFKCDTCERTFLRRQALVAHTAIHAARQPFICKDCGKVFGMKRSFDSHMLIHTGEKPYKCDVCEKSFRYKQILVAHTFIHTGEKPYTCNFCEKSFRQRQSLAALKLIHTGNKPFKCDICGVGFTRIEARNKHKLTHSDEKPQK
ncbi:zinc finger protein OZF-like isoform X7 [Periplaneta americana]|uniref:zinc finger protein OZF-like isoform X7 n=1 Tax=Periplaneta americana TaxID=6978 RepID=UPI0037E89837